MPSKCLQRAWKAGNASNRDAYLGGFSGRRTRSYHRTIDAIDREEKRESAIAARQAARTKAIMQQAKAQEAQSKLNRKGLISRVLGRIRKAIGV